ncbi:hypothetical protein JCM6882_002306 [Rhodosporidiobolus microsporus]
MLTNLALSSLLLLSAGSSLSSAAPVALPSLSPRTPSFSAAADASLDATLLERDLTSRLEKYNERVEEAKERVEAAKERVREKIEAAKERIEEKKKALEAKKGKKSSPVVIPLRNGPSSSVLADVSIGTPPQKLPLLVDTGSSDLWVMANVGAPDTFNLVDSSTLAITGEEVDLTFVSQTELGQIGSDVVTIGDLSIPNQFFAGVGGQGSPDFGGVLGLSFQNLAKIDKPTFFSNLVSSGQIPEASFGLYLSRDASVSSELTLGGANSKHYSGAQTAIPTVNGVQDWAIELASYSAGAKSVDIATVAMIDSGSTSSYIPKAAAAAIYSAIPGAYLDKSPEAAYSITLNGETYDVERYVYPCDATVAPAYTFKASDRKFEVSPKRMSLGFVDDEETLCASTIMGVDIKQNGATAALLGADFFQNYYTEFRFGDEKTAPSLVFATAKA